MNKGITKNVLIKRTIRYENKFFESIGLLKGIIDEIIINLKNIVKNINVFDQKFIISIEKLNKQTQIEFKKKHILNRMI